jgi:hypothetical protein
MARIRTIKPSFFTDSVLGEIDPLARLLFIALWTMADKAGRLKDRPAEIKVLALPYDTCDIEALLETLVRHDLAIRYQFWDGREHVGYLQVANFEKHQRPHHTEPESVIPPPPKVRTRAKTVRQPLDNLKKTQGMEGKGKEHVELDKTTVQLSVGKEGNGVGASAPCGASATGPSVRDQVEQVFGFWKGALHHPRAVLDRKRDKAIRARLAAGRTVDDITLAITGLANSPYHMGQNETRAVYDDIELICRDEIHLERFMALAGAPKLQEETYEERNERIGREVDEQRARRLDQAEQNGARPERPGRY